MNPLLRVDGTPYRIDFLYQLNSSQVKDICEIFDQFKKDGRKKIEAIKKVKMLLGTGLVESKDLIEAFEQFGVNEVLSKFRSPVERFKRYRRIDFETKVEKVKLSNCPICSQEPVDPVAVVKKSGERIGYFCLKCYEHLVMSTTFLVSEKEWAKAKDGIDKINEFAEKIKLDKNKRLC